MDKKKNKKPSWFMTAGQCSYSGLEITHPSSIVSSDPDTNFYADIARLGKNILLVKCYGYVTSAAESELLAFIDDFIKKHFESESGIFYIEDYADLTGGDAESRKKYISYFANNHFFIAGIFFNLPAIYRLSVNLVKKLHLYAARAHAVNTYEQAIDLVQKIIDQDSSSHITDDNQSVAVSGDENRLPKAFRSGIFGFFPRFVARLKAGDLFFTQKARQSLAQKYSEELIKYIATIDWRKTGLVAPESLLGDDVSSKKLFDAISFIKSEIDTLMEERDIAEAILRENEARYRFLVERAKAGLLEYDFTAEKIVSVNDALVEMFGYSEEALLEISPLEILSRESRPIFEKRMAQRLSGHTVSQDAVYECVKKDGTTLWVLINSNITRQNDLPEKATVVITDITKMKLSEQQLLEYQEKLKHLSIRLSMVEEDQRRSMASHLHETIGQELFVMQLQLNKFEKSMANPVLLETLSPIKEQLLKIIKETKALTFDLSPPVLYDFGFEEALKALAEMIESKHGIHVKTCFEGKMDVFEDEIKVILYRNVKELIHNSVKHAGAENIMIRLKNSKTLLDVELTDDGIGFDSENYFAETVSGDGFGLFDIKEKLNHLGGNLIIDSTPGKGTSICMQVPLQVAN